jgi:hypothetical protein
MTDPSAGGSAKLLGAVAAKRLLGAFSRTETAPLAPGTYVWKVLKTAIAATRRSRATGITIGGTNQPFMFP